MSNRPNSFAGTVIVAWENKNYFLLQSHFLSAILVRDCMLVSRLCLWAMEQSLARIVWAVLLLRAATSAFVLPLTSKSTLPLFDVASCKRPTSWPKLAVTCLLLLWLRVAQKHQGCNSGGDVGSLAAAKEGPGGSFAIAASKQVWVPHSPCHQQMLHCLIAAGFFCFSSRQSKWH